MGTRLRECYPGYRASTAFRVITPGSSAGEPLHVLSSLERRSPRWDTDPESARAALSAAVSLAACACSDAIPIRPRARSTCCSPCSPSGACMAGKAADLGALLLDDLAEPAHRRRSARCRSTASCPRPSAARSPPRSTPCSRRPPSRAGARAPRSTSASGSHPKRRARRPAVIVSVAHLDDEERALVLGVLLEEVLSWVRSLPGHPAPARAGGVRRGLRLSCRRTRTTRPPSARSWR